MSQLLEAERATEAVTATDPDDDCNLYGLFICEDYVEKFWTFADLKQPLLCSNMSSTDHDLTGQIVWPACVLLSWFIYHNRAKFTDKVLTLHACNHVYHTAHHNVLYTPHIL